MTIHPVTVMFSGMFLTNVQVMFTNGLSDTSYLPSGYYSSDWYISSGAFFPANGSISDYLSDHFSTDTNINVKYAPVYNRFISGDTISTNNEITTENVD